MNRMSQKIQTTLQYLLDLNYLKNRMYLKDLKYPKSR